MTRVRPVLCVLAICAVVGAGVELAAIAGPANRAGERKTVFPVNVHGMTYGSALDAVSPETEPDLIEAVLPDGTHGYVRSKDLTPAGPTTPADVATRIGRVRSRSIPLYAVDGVTVIGSFFLAAPYSGS